MENPQAIPGTAAHAQAQATAGTQMQGGMAGKIAKAQLPSSVKDLDNTVKYISFYSTHVSLSLPLPLVLVLRGGIHAL